MLRFRLITVFILLLPGIVLGQGREKILAAKTFKNAKAETLLYRLFVPKNYDRKKKYPLVVYLHGGGGRGNDNLKQIEGGNGYLIDFFTQAETQSRYPGFVIAPQSPVTEGWVEYDSMTPNRQLRLVFELIRDLEKTYSIDDNRLYVAGQSMGGFGAFAIIAEYPRLFAAGVPLCGGGDESKVSRLTGTPIWAFHGEKDQSVAVERSRDIVAAIKKAGGQAKYTEYAGEGHNIWLKVVKEPDLLSWLFSQRKP
ncbi:MAG TPA: prolyl oligopeptidase family serine peptidase [Pyrinomonadaceae bacterium]|nr:prolyl oligopeptidase family serine peptidase [Pyrinomonadaceae bacterium]